MQQSHKDQPLLDQAKVLNAICKKGEESLLSLILEEVLAANIVNETAAAAAIGNKRDKISGY